MNPKGAAIFVFELSIFDFCLSGRMPGLSGGTLGIMQFELFFT